MASSSFLTLPSSVSPKSSLVLSKPTTKSTPSSLFFFNSSSLKTTTTTTNNNKSFSISSERNVTEFDPKEEVVSGGGTDLGDELRLHVHNLAVSVDSAQLVELFGKIGKVEMAKVIYDKMTGKSRGFAYVHMSTVEEAKAAARRLNGFRLEKMKMFINYGPLEDKPRFRPPRHGSGGVGLDTSIRCYVGNLSLNVDVEDFFDLFDVPGKVLEAGIVYDRESGRSFGFGFVTYASYEEVDNAISSLNGVKFYGQQIQVIGAASAEERRNATCVDENNTCVQDTDLDNATCVQESDENATCLKDSDLDIEKQNGACVQDIVT